MKITKEKKLNLIILYIIFGIALIFINTKDNLKSLRLEVKKFYEVKLDSCKINQIVQRNQPTIRGHYFVIYTNCSGDYFPLILDSLSHDINHIFKKNSIIIKKPKSLEAAIITKGESFDFKIKDPKDINDRWESNKVIMIFIAISTVLVILLPNSAYDKMKKAQPPFGARFI